MATYACGKCERTLPEEAFSPSHRQNGYYCRECDSTYQKDRWRRIAPRRACAHCGQDVPVGRGRRSRYCNDSCRDAARSLRRYGEPKPDKYPQLRDRAWFREQYVDKGLSERAIAALVGCSRGAVRDARQVHGLPARTSHDAVCELCGETFQTKTARRVRFCSVAHEIRYRSLGKLYGITAEEYRAVVQRQGEKCAICETEDCASGKSLAIDHDHRNGQVRGLLCANCNNGLGRFGDDPDLLRAAIKYLDNS